jgi:hypothetical protein
MQTNPESDYESEVLDVLAYEFSFDSRAEYEDKIKRRLREKNLGPYDQKRIEFLRRFKDEVQSEIGKFSQSSYYMKRLGKYAKLKDFDVKRSTRDMASRYPEIPRPAIKSFIPYAVYLYYLR